MGAWIPKEHNCYEDALIMLVQGLFEKEGSKCFLVHGYPRLTQDVGGFKTGTKYGHAWIERDTDFNGYIYTEYIDVLKGTAIPRDVAYVVGGILEEEVTRFDAETAMKTALREGVNGPWKDVPEDAVFN